MYAIEMLYYNILVSSKFCLTALKTITVIVCVCVFSCSELETLSDHLIARLSD